MRTVLKVIATLVVINARLLFCEGTSSLNYQIVSSPCPKIFQYAIDGSTYYGLITLRNVSYGTTTLQIELSQPEVLNQEYVRGDLLPTMDFDMIANNIEAGMPINYRVNFPMRGVVSRVTDISVNGVSICSGPADPPPRSTLKMEQSLIIPNPRQSAGQQQQPYVVLNVGNSLPDSSVTIHGHTFYAKDVFNWLFPAENPLETTTLLPNTGITSQSVSTSAPETESSISSNIDSICGQENDNFSTKKLAVNGTVIDKSRFPWIVAIYTRETSTMSFQCGGSLISARTVVSAAHCFQQEMEVIKIENLILSMGRHILTEWDNTVNLGVQKLIRHPDYRPELESADADVAILQLAESVTFSPTIRPVCLWQEPTDVEGTNGIVVGWGEDETNTGVVSIPKLVNATIVSELTCIRSNDKFIYLTSNRTLCAGNRDGSGPCMGDSGSGLMVQIRNKWMLRGTVSTSLLNRAKKCDLNEYVVYSDIAKFVDWIKSNMLF